MISRSGRAKGRVPVLPHERWIAAKASRNSEPPQGTAKWRMLQNYGPRGVALQVAGALNVLVGFALGLLAIVLLAVSKGEGTLGNIGTVVVLVGIAIMIFGMVRIAQCASAGRKYRNGRAFIRPGR